MVKTLLGIYHGRIAYPSMDSLTDNAPSTVETELRDARTA
jgi:hypothetical protein